MSVLVLHHSWREPPISTRELTESEDRLVRACVPDLLAFSSFEPRDQSQTAMLLLEHRDSAGEIGAFTVAGALRLSEMLRDVLPDLAGDISSRF